MSGDGRHVLTTRAEQSGSEPSMRFDVRSMTEMWAVEWGESPWMNL